MKFQGHPKSLKVVILSQNHHKAMSNYRDVSKNVIQNSSKIIQGCPKFFQPLYFLIQKIEYIKVIRGSYIPCHN